MNTRTTTDAGRCAEQLLWQMARGMDDVKVLLSRPDRPLAAPDALADRLDALALLIGGIREVAHGTGTGTAWTGELARLSADPRGGSTAATAALLASHAGGVLANAAAMLSTASQSLRRTPGSAAALGPFLAGPAAGLVAVG